MSIANELDISVNGADIGVIEKERRSAKGAPEQLVPVPPLQQFITAFVLFGPLVGVVIAAIALFGHGVSALDLILAAVFYAITGHGVTAGFHRMCTHRAFRANRVVKIVLVTAGSMSFEGSILAWVANHRRHHAYTDIEGDPHSPYEFGSSIGARIRGAGHAHMGWFFGEQSADLDRWIPDLLHDHDLKIIDRLFPLLCVVSLAAPFVLGWTFTGTFFGALDAFIWAGLVRVFVLQQSTFAVNSACHIWGNRPFRTRDGDRATNFAPLSILAMGESWHNLHHSNPRLARHGVDRFQLDSTAVLIRSLERAGLVFDVRWPDALSLNARRTEECPRLRVRRRG